MIRRHEHSTANPGTLRPPLLSSGVWLEVLGMAALLGGVAYNLVVSWRKWNHPLIDFGRELYIPWRLSEGAVLYRDVDDVYGPLSQHFNAAIFRIFGPGLMVLVTANLLIFAAILGLSYTLFRRAWGATGAFAACAVFVAVFAFSQFIGISNFNYATPYAHEATHGMLVCLALVAALGRWLEQPKARTSFAAGLLVGLTLVLKPEFILAAAAVTLATGAIYWRRTGRIPRSSLAGVFGGALLPTAAFTLHFSRFFPWSEAVQAASRAWWSLLLAPDIVGKNYQQIFLGFDQPWKNLAAHGGKTLLAVLTLGTLGWIVSRALRCQSAAAQRGGLALATALALLIGWKTEWGSIGRCLLGLNLIYLGMVWRGRLRRAHPAPGADGLTVGWRVLLGILATALMARMLLNGRIVQFGFFQAALAAMVVVAVVSSECAEWLPAGKGRRAAGLLVTLALLFPGFISLAKVSARFLQAETYPVGEGRDRFYSFPPEIDSTGYLINAVLKILRELPPQSKILTLPEGGMINYLARRPNPLPQFQFYSFTTEGGRERAVVTALAADPPDYVVIISRGLRDFGIARYGEREGAGKLIMEWLAERYQITHKIGDDPLDSDQRGAYVLAPKPKSGA